MMAVGPLVVVGHGENVDGEIRTQHVRDYTRNEDHDADIKSDGNVV